MATPRSTQNWPRTFRFVYLYLMLLIPLSVLGFWKSYLSLIGGMPAYMTYVVHVHAILMFWWLLMLISQAGVIRMGWFRTHRIVGRTSYVIAPIIIILGLVTLRNEFSRTLDFVQIDVGAFGMVVAFALTWILGMAYRKRPRIHMRYMVSTAFAISSAIVFRICFSWVPNCDTNSDGMTFNYGLLILALLILIVRDWQLGIRRSPYWVVTAVLALSYIGYWTFAKTEWWFSFCAWVGRI